LDFLITDKKGIYVDCTLGGGGHFRGILEKTDEQALIIGIDRDPEVIEQAAVWLDLGATRIEIIHSNFSSLAMIFDRLSIDLAEGILLDLGVSSFQLDDPGRGFSYQHDSTLDMRMDLSQSFTARELVNTWPEEKLEQILKVYGEERFARSIARGIVRARRERELETTGQLVEIVKSSTPSSYHREKHPARRTFQALRIAVNEELNALENTLPQAVKRLKPGGRLCVITFHSLEDRVVKEFFVQEARGCLCPPRQPICTCGHQPEIKILTKRPIIPSSDEISANPRARSAKLRVAEKLEF
jgi:16S rRNA (cytosine1402-N4)-methyltransferase